MSVQGGGRTVLALDSVRSSGTDTQLRQLQLALQTVGNPEDLGEPRHTRPVCIPMHLTFVVLGYLEPQSSLKNVSRFQAV